MELIGSILQKVIPFEFISYPFMQNALVQMR